MGRRVSHVLISLRRDPIVEKVLRSEWTFIGDNLSMSHRLQIGQTQRIFLPLCAVSIIQASTSAKELVELLLALAVRAAQLRLEGPLAPRPER